VVISTTIGSSQYLDGACTAQDDYTVYVRARGLLPPGLECLPYTLSYNFVSGLCR
jgi:hypothetical protein